MGEPDEVFAVQLGATRVRELALREEFETLLLNHPYVMSSQRSSTHWGGAGESLEIAAGIAQSVAAAAVWEGLKAVGRKHGASDRTERPLGEQEAFGHAAMLIAPRYSVDFNALRLISVELRDSGSSATVLVALDGSDETYEVDLEIAEGLLLCGRIKHNFGR